MKFTIFALLLLTSLMTGVAGIAESVETKTGQTNTLISRLPASDGVAVIEPKRFLNDALPRVLAANQPMLGEVTAKLDQMAAKTGIDLRKFDQVAVGVNVRAVGKGTDVDTLAIASGDINAGAMIAIGKLAANGSYREEKAGDKAIYVFSAKDLIKNAPVKVTNSKVAGVIDDVVGHMTRDVAVTALDTKTIAMGSLARVRETLEGKSRVGGDLTSLLSGKEAAVVSFAFKPVGGLSQFIPLDNDELGRNVDSIQYIAGSLDVTTAGASVHAMARTKAAAQATGLKDTLEGLQSLGGLLFGASKRADQQVYGRMIKGVKFGASGTDVTIDLLVPQSDIDTLLGAK